MEQPIEKRSHAFAFGDGVDDYAGSCSAARYRDQVIWREMLSYVVTLPNATTSTTLLQTAIMSGNHQICGQLNIVGAAPLQDTVVDIALLFVPVNQSAQNISVPAAAGGVTTLYDPSQHVAYITQLTLPMSITRVNASTIFFETKKFNAQVGDTWKLALATSANPGASSKITLVADIYLTP